jgi:hypothetical protein
MDFSKIMLHYYSGKSWMCGETYESLVWNEEVEPKPTQEHLESLWIEVLKKVMRKERNKLLKDTDYTALPDYPAVNKEEWMTYRQSLRDFPATWTEGIAFPNPPA